MAAVASTDSSAPDQQYIFEPLSPPMSPKTQARWIQSVIAMVCRRGPMTVSALVLAIIMLALRVVHDGSHALCNVTR